MKLQTTAWECRFNQRKNRYKDKFYEIMSAYEKPIEKAVFPEQLKDERDKTLNKEFAKLFGTNFMGDMKKSLGFLNQVSAGVHWVQPKSFKQLRYYLKLQMGLDKERRSSI